MNLVLADVAGPLIADFKTAARSSDIRVLQAARDARFSDEAFD
jgi:hypothetical protein